VDKASVMKKVRDSSGANYSFHKEQAKPQVGEKPQPVGSNYQKPEIMGRSKGVNATVFTQPSNDDTEKKRIIEERKRQEEEERKRVQEQDKSRDDADKRAKEAEQKRANDAKNQAESQARAQAQAQSSANDQKKRQEEEERKRREEEERRRREEEEAASVPAASTAKPSSSGGFSATVTFDYSAADTNELSLTIGDTITGIEVIDEGWWQGYDSNGSYGMFPSGYVSKNDGNDAAPAVPAVPAHTSAPAAAGNSALSIYDYQGADDSELSFGEGELITEIEFVDENWWQGKNASGYFGMFPAQYVQLQ